MFPSAKLLSDSQQFVDEWTGRIVQRIERSAIEAERGSGERKTICVFFPIFLDRNSQLFICEFCREVNETDLQMSFYLRPVNERSQETSN